MMPRWRWSPAFLWLFIMVATTCGSWTARSKHKPIKEEDWEITCFTCANVSNNNGCNRHAVDRPCPKGTDYCHTLHVLDRGGASVLVTKKCARKSECRPVDVGCYKDGVKPELTKCVACCDLQYCNEFIPTNDSTAVLISTRLSNDANKLQGIYHKMTVCFVPIMCALYHYIVTKTQL